ncbi:hypothetical protein ACP6EW_08605 [Hafnia paralvei]|uniref:hypothetical protein n=1 Tax=Hafnia paralvei TaxID=546367 RepID=UPI000FA524C9|nr:hypothetical protein [Hafnia paralvei]TBM02140.1 hypothetical protein EYY87_19585 [Hafnia paralvei]
MKRPLCVWCVLFILMLFILFFIPLSIHALFSSIALINKYPSLNIAMYLTVEFIIRVVIAIVMIWAIVSVFKRKKLGRPLASLSLVIIFSMMIYAHNSAIGSSNLLFTLDNDAQRAGAYLADLIEVLLFAILLFRFNLSHASKKYFTKESSIKRIDT